MDAHNDSTRPPHEPAPNRPRSGIAGFALVLLIVILLGRAALLFFLSPSAPTAPRPVATVRAVAQADTAVPHATSLPPTAVASPQVSPLVTLTPSLTPRPLRLAVEQGLYDRFQPFFAQLKVAGRGLQLFPYPSHAQVDDALAVQTCDWAISWATTSPEKATLLREEPYVPVVHPLVTREGFTRAQLIAIAQGQDQSYKLIQGDDGKALRELLGLDELSSNVVQVADWPAAREYVATHEEAIALLPWEAVNFRVRTLPVEGQRFDPRHPQGYPLLRRLWLRGEAPIPQTLATDLRRALAYDYPATVELVAVGDVMLDRYVKGKMKDNSPLWPFQGEGVQPLLSGADIAFANLECAISTRGTRQAKSYTFRADPDAVQGLTYAGLDVLSLANNHNGDYGDLALTDTFDYLDQAHIAYVGAGRNITEAHEAKIVSANGLRIAFLAYSQVPPESFSATASSPGDAWMDPERMVADVRAARAEADLVVVSCHWGVEYSAYATPSQAHFAQLLSEAGAALIIGHHPHVVQGLRYDKTTFTAYSLGNFVFDIDATREAEESIALRCILDASGVKSVELIPALLNIRPVLISAYEGPQAQDGARIVGRMLRLSKEQGTLPQ